MCINHAGNGTITHSDRFSQDGIYRYFGFFYRRMSQERDSIQISTSIYTRHRSLKLGIYLDALPSGICKRQVFQPEALRHRTSPYTQEQFFCLETGLFCSCLIINLHTGLILLQTDNLGSQFEVNTSFCIIGTEHRSNFTVYTVQYFVHHFDNGHFYT